MDEDVDGFVAMIASAFLFTRGRWSETDGRRTDERKA